MRLCLAAVTVPVSLAIASSPTPAQTTPAQTTPAQTTEQTPAPTTVCAYNPNGGVPNPLGIRAFITISEIEGNSVFMYEQFPSPVAVANPAEREPATIANQRTLTLFNTPIAEARQRVINDPTYYAELLGTSVESLGDNNDFSEVNDTLLYQDDDVANAPATPAPPSAPPETPETTLADLPDGNYQVASADLPFRVVSTEELLSSKSTVFLFRKTGNAVVGNFFYPETDASVCITGTLVGNIVTGKASTEGTEATVPDASALTLSNQAMGGRFIDAVLNLDTFSRINAGTVLPPQECR